MQTKLRTYPNSFWSLMKMKTFLTIGTPIVANSIIAPSIDLYCKYFEIERVVYVNILDQPPYQSMIHILNYNQF